MWDTIHTIINWPGTKWLLLVMAFVMPVASLLTWAERRQSAMMQDRLGPNRANIPLGRIDLRLKGILHFVADAIKMIGKEDFIPANAHRPLFSLAPILALAPVLVAFAIIPFGPTIFPHSLGEVLDIIEWEQAVGLTAGGVPEGKGWTDAIPLQIYSVEFGLLFYFAILTIANYGATIAGWASYNKWALLGGLRSSSQMMSYEVAMGLSLMGVFIVMGTLEPGAMTLMQGANPITWGWAVQPLACLLFFVAAIAETKRAPFDIPEGEPEIIGYFVEYSGIRWGMFFLAEFIEIVFISAVMTTVFFGGYNFPFLEADGFRGFGLYLPLDHWAVVAIQFATWGAKVIFFCWLQLAIRWTLPRFRGDQLMDLGWKLLLPLALFNIMATALVNIFFAGSLATQSVINWTIFLLVIVIIPGGIGRGRTVAR